jgi:hypothetical protein
LVDKNAKPARLSYPFLKFITRDFSEEIGHGGFGVVYLVWFFDCVHLVIVHVLLLNGKCVAKLI